MGASASREKFRESVTALVEVDVSPDDADFWDELWKIPSSADEVFELISPTAARRLRDKRFDNLATLFTQATAQLCQIVETPYNIYFDQALNCVRVLTRILPFLLEKGDLGDSDPNVELLCWGTDGSSADDEDETNPDRQLLAAAANGVAAALGSSRRKNNDSIMGLVVGGSGNDDETTDASAPSTRRRGRKSRSRDDTSTAASRTIATNSIDEDTHTTPRGRGSVEEDDDDDDDVDDDEEDIEYDDDDDDDDDEDEDDDNQEPLALLVVHAAMHMLFLPQFTCDFYEDEGEDATELMTGGSVGTSTVGSMPDGTLESAGTDGSSARGDGDASTANGSSPRKVRKGRSGLSSLTATMHHQNATPAQRKENARWSKLDTEIRAEAGVSSIRHSDSGVLLIARPPSIVWAAGVGVTPSQLGYDGSTRKYDKNRLEVLRLLLAACCDPLFCPADEYNPLASRWLSVAVAADAPNAVCLFYSLLNTVLSYDPNALGVPYSSAFASDTHVQLVEISAQVLCVLLDAGLPGNPEGVVDDSAEPVVEFDEASRAGFNIFRTILSRINSTKELSFVYKGFVRLLRNVYESKSTYLPNSVANMECFQELLVLFWKLMEENPMFMPHILTQCDVNEVIVPICFLMYQARRDPAQIGLIHICTFVLLKLSGERSFGVSLNKPFTKRLPCDLPTFSGSHADLISITLHKLIVNGSYKLVPLYSCFLTVICNISPYWRKMSLVAAVKLVNLFELFSSPKFLYSGENAHRHLALLLEVFNNVIQYQYNGNQHLVYAIIRRKDSFGRLASLTLRRAIAQFKKVYGGHTTVQYDADADAAKEIVSTTDVDEKGNPVSVSPRSNDGLSNRNASTDLRSNMTADASEVRSSVNSVSRGDDDDDDEDDVDIVSSAASSIAGDRFIPTALWLSDLKSSLPLETVTRLLQHLVPVVDEVCARKNGVVDETEILDVLKDVTMVGLLPVPHAIVIRKYQPNQYTALWFTAFLWGVIFLRNQNPPIFDGGAIELFQVSVDQPDDD